jgi:hypothetical protein
MCMCTAQDRIGLDYMHYTGTAQNQAVRSTLMTAEAWHKAHGPLPGHKSTMGVRTVHAHPRHVHLAV